MTANNQAVTSEGVNNKQLSIYDIKNYNKLMSCKNAQKFDAKVSDEKDNLKILKNVTYKLKITSLNNLQNELIESITQFTNKYHTLNTSEIIISLKSSKCSGVWIGGCEKNNIIQFVSVNKKQEQSIYSYSLYSVLVEMREVAVYFH